MKVLKIYTSFLNIPFQHQFLTVFRNWKTRSMIDRPIILSHYSNLPCELRFVQLRSAKSQQTVIFIIEGVSRGHINRRNGRRCSTAKAYLRPAMKRKNLDVVIGAHTTKASGASSMAYDSTSRLSSNRSVLIQFVDFFDVSCNTTIFFTAFIIVLTIELGLVLN